MSLQSQNSPKHPTITTTSDTQAWAKLSTEYHPLIPTPVQNLQHGSNPAPSPPPQLLRTPPSLHDPRNMSKMQMSLSHTPRHPSTRTIIPIQDLQLQNHPPHAKSYTISSGFRCQLPKGHPSTHVQVAPGTHVAKVPTFPHSRIAVPRHTTTTAALTIAIQHHEPDKPIPLNLAPHAPRAPPRYPVQKK